MPHRASSIFVVLLLTACSEDETAPVNVGPTGNPTLALKSPAPSETPICVSVGEDIDARVPIVTDVQQFVLRPPGTCNTFVQCGHMALFTCEPQGCPEDKTSLTGKTLNNEAAVRSIDLLLGRLGDRYHDNTLHQATDPPVPDLLHVEIDIMKDAATVATDHDGKALSAELSFVTLEGPCCENLAAQAEATQSGGGTAEYSPGSWNDGITEEECVAAGCGTCLGKVDNSARANGAWIQYEWDAPVLIGSMWLDTNACAEPCDTAAVASGTVQYWDGAEWQTAQTFSDQTDDFGVTFSPSVKTTRLRIYDITAADCEHAAQSSVYEWYVYPGPSCQP